MGLAGVSLSTLMYHSEQIMRLKVYCKPTLLPSWAKSGFNQFLT